MKTNAMLLAILLFGMSLAGCVGQTDEAGHTWRSMDDGTIMWWNGTDWQQV